MALIGTQSAYLEVHGTAASITESEVIAGGGTVVYHIVPPPNIGEGPAYASERPRWHPDLGSDNALTTAFLDAITGNGNWNTAVRPLLDFTRVTREEFDIAVTLPAVAGYTVTNEEEITFGLDPSFFENADSAGHPVEFATPFWVYEGSVNEITTNISSQLVLSSGVHLIQSSITASANIILTGNAVLRLRPGCDLFFDSANDAAVSGGGMFFTDPIDVPTDEHGIWLLNDARIHARGAPKVGWINGRDNDGSINDDPTWLLGDTLVTTPIGPNVDGRADITFDETFTAGSVVPSHITSDGIQRFADIMNLTRDVKIRGRDGGNAHVMMNGGRWHAWEYVELERMGPRQADAGRYPLHWHFTADGSFGSYAHGVSIHRSSQHGFVPHEANGVRIFDGVAYDVLMECYWWDPQFVSSFIRWDHCIGARVAPSGNAEVLRHIFLLGSVEHETSSCIDCVATGHDIHFGQSSAFRWPGFSVESREDRFGNPLPNIWKFRDCVAHNNRSTGLGVWQNTFTHPHDIDNYLGFHNSHLDFPPNASMGIDHGAYGNLYHYGVRTLPTGDIITGNYLVDNGRNLVQHTQVTKGTPGIRPDGYGLTFESIEIHGNTYSVELIRHNLPSNTPALYKNVSLNANLAGRKIWIHHHTGGTEGFNNPDRSPFPGRYDFVYDAGFAGTKLNILDPLAEIEIETVEPGSILRIQDPDSGHSAVEVDLAAGTVTDIDDFYDFTPPPLTQGVTPQIVNETEHVNDDTGATSTQVGITPQDGNGLYIFVATREVQPTGHPALSGGGLNYQLIVSSIHSTEDGAHYAYYAKVEGDPGAMTITATLPNSGRATVYVIEVSNDDGPGASAELHPDGNISEPVRISTFLTERSGSRVFTGITTAVFDHWDAGNLGTVTGEDNQFLTAVLTGGTSGSRFRGSYSTFVAVTQQQHEAGWDSTQSKNRVRFVIVEALGLELSAPDPPTNVVAVAGPGEDEATITWDPPLNEGSAPIEDYTVFALSADPDREVTLPPVISMTTQAVFSGLEFGFPYQFAVTTSNAHGSSDQSIESNELTLLAGNDFSLFFDGVSDYVDVGTLGTFGSQLATCTVEFWIKTAEARPTRAAMGLLEDAGVFNDDTGFFVGINDPNAGDVSLFMRDSRDPAASDRHQFIITGAGIFDNQWHHVAFAVDDYETAQATAYLDGEPVPIIINTSGSPSNTFNNFEIPFFIGALHYHGTDDFYVEALIDEVRLWTVARTPSQIADNFHEVLSGTESGLFAYWRFEEGTGATTADSVNGHNGTLVGLPDWQTDAPALEEPPPSGDFPTLVTTLFHPHVEYEFTSTAYTGNPFDQIVTITFAHEDSCAVVSTDAFHVGSDTWRFRFSGLRTGNWHFTVVSADVSDVNELTGTVVVNPIDPTLADGLKPLRTDGHYFAVQTDEAGTLKAVPWNVWEDEHDGSGWGALSLLDWEAAGEAEQIVGDQCGAALTHGMDSLYINPHIQFWLIGAFDWSELPTNTPDPDLRTFDVLDRALDTAAANGCRLHIWLWGDNASQQSPVGVSGGINGSIDQRLQRYIAARLGPRLNWTTNYGWDLMEWVSTQEVAGWFDFMQERMGDYPHLFMARDEQTGSLEFFTPDNLPVFSRDERFLSGEDPYDTAVGNLADAEVGDSTSGVSPVGQNPDDWQLLFEDNFDGTELDTTKWVPAFPWGTPTCSTSDNTPRLAYRPENVIVSNGTVKLEARDEPFSCEGAKDFTSGIITNSKFFSEPGGLDAYRLLFQYGYAEARVRIPPGGGLWPAFWLLPPEGAWPPEIDIAEWFASTDTIEMHYHYLDENDVHQDSGGASSGHDFTQMHVVGMEWGPDAIRWFLDGVESRAPFTQAQFISNQPMYLLLNLQVGGFVGDPEDDPNYPNQFPAQYEIDYVRVWKSTTAPRPVLLERRYVHLRDEGLWDMEMTRRSMWQFTMAGGVGAIWGRDDMHLTPYPNPEQLATHSTFWHNYLFADMVRDDSLINTAGGLALRRNDASTIAFYAEGVSQVSLNLVGEYELKGVNTLDTYQEISLGTVVGSSTVVLPQSSDWAIVATVVEPVDPTAEFALQFDGVDDSVELSNEVLLGTVINDFALEFDGVDDFVQLPQVLTDATALTLEFWTKFPSFPNDAIALDIGPGEFDSWIEIRPFQTNVSEFALDFDGTDDHIDVGTLGSFGSQLATCSVEFWIKTTDSTSFVQAMGLHDDDVSGFDHTAFSIGVNDPTAGDVALFIRDSQDSTSSDRRFFIVEDAGITDGAWHHVAFVVNDYASGDADAYIDGSLATVTVQTDGIPANTFENFSRPFTIGALNLNGTIRDHIDAIIDEVRLWTVARSGPEIADNMDQVISGSTSGLAAYWRFEEGSGTTAADETPNNNDGTITGAVYTGDTAPLQTTTGGEVRFGLTNQAASRTFFEAATVFDANVWTHIACTWDGTTMRVFLNGVEDVNTGVFSGTLANSTAHRLAGQLSGEASRFAGAIFDEVRIWTIARTPTEIADSMNRVLGGDKSGLVGYWRFEEGSGATATDATPNGNDGTINGATYTTDESPANEPDPGSPASIVGERITIELWAKANWSSLTQAQARLFNSRHSNGGNSEFRQFHNQNLTFIVGNGTNTTFAHAYPGMEVPLDNTWIFLHYQWEYDSVNDEFVVRAGHDGIWAQTSTPLPGRPVMPDTALHLGAFRDTNFFQGIIDQVRLWNIIRTEEEIRSNMRQALLGSEHGLVNYWPAGEGSGTSIEDIVGGQNGTITGATWVTDSAPLIVNGFALDFDGVDDFVALPPAALPINALTIEAWVKIRTHKDFTTLVLNRWTSAGDWLLYASSTDWIWGMRDSSNAIINFAIGHNGVTDWVHLAGTYDGTMQRFYVNGVEVEFPPTHGTILATDGPFELSRTSNDVLDGLMDEVRIWSVARTQSEIAGDRFFRLGGTEPGLVGYWRLDESEGMVAGDFTSNGHDGTINGATWTTVSAPLVTGVVANVDTLDTVAEPLAPAAQTGLSTTPDTLELVSHARSIVSEAGAVAHVDLLRAVLEVLPATIDVDQVARPDPVIVVSETFPATVVVDAIASPDVIHVTKEVFAAAPAAGVVAHVGTIAAEIEALPPVTATGSVASVATIETILRLMAPDTEVGEPIFANADIIQSLVTVLPARPVVKIFVFPATLESEIEALPAIPGAGLATTPDVIHSTSAVLAPVARTAVVAHVNAIDTVAETLDPTIALNVAANVDAIEVTARALPPRVNAGAIANLGTVITEIVVIALVGEVTPRPVTPAGARHAPIIRLEARYG